MVSSCDIHGSLELSDIEREFHSEGVAVVSPLQPKAQIVLRIPHFRHIDEMSCGSRKLMPQ